MLLTTVGLFHVVILCGVVSLAFELVMETLLHELTKFPLVVIDSNIAFSVIFSYGLGFSAQVYGRGNI